MQVGTPVVTSREGSLPEVGGEAVYYVNAYDEDDIERGVAEVFASSEMQNELSKKGLEQAKKFSWKTTAEQTVANYKKVLTHER